MLFFPLHSLFSLCYFSLSLSPNLFLKLDQGKTTLLENIVKGRIDGCHIQSGITVGYYRQDFSTLNYDHTILESLYDASPNAAEDLIRKTASAFLLTGPIVHQKISTLSEGQKALCAYARLVLQEPGLLILDEPTNHINFRHLPALANALNDYKGALILVSHDKTFVDKVQMDHTLNLGDEMERFTLWLKTEASRKKKTVEIPIIGAKGPAIPVGGKGRKVIDAELVNSLVHSLSGLTLQRIPERRHTQTVSTIKPLPLGFVPITAATTTATNARV